eukprot:m.70837 g.70837  ORF g.70837 m.70837 type:complete len:295 (-) comp14325_c0_seq1:216-1100(-)
MVNVTVFGAGRMGIRTGVFLALEGQNVTLHDTTPPDLTMVRMLLDKQVSEGYYTVVDARAAEGRIKYESNLSAACDAADVVLEMVPEQESLKEKVLRDISQNCSPSCIIATNTLTLSVTTLAKYVALPERFLGIRFLFPVLNIPDVEITLGADTGKHTIDQAKTWLVGMDLSPFFKPPGRSDSLVLTPEEITQRQYAHYQLKNSKRGGASKQTLSPAQIYYTDGGSGAPPQPASSTASEGAECVVCLTKPKDSLLYPCGHLSFCGLCARQLLETRATCPVCRYVIQDVVRVYNV